MHPAGDSHDEKSNDSSSGGPGAGQGLPEYPGPPAPQGNATIRTSEGPVMSHRSNVPRASNTKGTKTGKLVAAGNLSGRSFDWLVRWMHWATLLDRLADGIKAVQVEFLTNELWSATDLGVALSSLFHTSSGRGGSTEEMVTSGVFYRDTSTGLHPTYSLISAQARSGRTRL